MVFAGEVGEDGDWDEFGGDHAEAVDQAGGGDALAGHHRFVADAGDGAGVHDAGAEGFGFFGAASRGEVGGGWADDQGGAGDAGVFEFGGKGLGEGEDIGFGGEVGGHPWAGHEGGDGSNVEDAAFFSLDHGGDEQAGEVGESFDVEAEELELAVD